jgi:hypothetical protein
MKTVHNFPVTVFCESHNRLREAVVYYAHTKKFHLRRRNRVRVVIVRLDVVAFDSQNAIDRFGLHR